MSDDEQPRDHRPRRRARSGEPVGDEPTRPAGATELEEIVRRKTDRRQRARQGGGVSIWSYLGTFGLVGWTVAVPTLLGLMIGVYVENRWAEGSNRAVITGLVLGAAVGSAMAWYWVRRESEEER